MRLKKWEKVKQPKNPKNWGQENFAKRIFNEIINKNGVSVFGCSTPTRTEKKENLFSKGYS